MEEVHDNDRVIQTRVMPVEQCRAIIIIIRIVGQDRVLRPMVLRAPKGAVECDMSPEPV